MTTGVYKITNLVNGKVYIGASKRIERRFTDHKKCTGSPIHSDLEALGVENFKFEILLECPETMLAQWERDMICLYDADDPEKGYNSPMDRPYNPKVSESLKGKPAWNKGISHTEEERRKISEACKGKPSSMKGKHLSEEHKRKISEANKGHMTSNETRRKISEANKGKSIPDEMRRRISETLKGHKHTDEAKRKISEACKGITRSEETKRKLSEARRLYWQKKKENI